MTFYSLTNSAFTRLFPEEVGMAFSAFDCVLNHEKAVYASAELTSGLRLYNALRAAHLKSSKELKLAKGEPWFTANIWDPNVNSARDFAADARDALGGKTLVITPAPFNAPKWTQPEYLAFWEQLLRTRISSTWFKSDWQYSNGCTFEFAVCNNAGLPTFDHRGHPINLRQATDLIEAAIRDLASSGFDTTKLQENLARLQSVPV